MIRGGGAVQLAVIVWIGPGRIVFAHAKDVAYGEDGQWRYVLPGRGVIDWSRFASLYDGFVSIEHEDDEYAPAEGMAFAVEHLR